MGNIGAKIYEVVRLVDASLPGDMPDRNETVGALAAGLKSLAGIPGGEAMLDGICTDIAQMIQLIEIGDFDGAIVLADRYGYGAMVRATIERADEAARIKASAAS